MKVTDRRTARAAARRASKTRGLLVAVIASAGAVALGLSGAGVTFAFLSDSETVPQATVTAGTFSIQIDGRSSATLQDMKLSPQQPAARAFTVTNTGDAPADLSARIAAPGGPAYAASVLGAVSKVKDADACTGALAGTTPLNGYTQPALDSLAPNESRVYCLVASLPNPTAATGSGTPLSFTVTIDAVQKGA